MTRRPLTLRCRDGHFEMAAFGIKPAPGGFWMWVSCSFGGEAAGHWLAPESAHPGRIVVQPTPHVWLSASAAWLAHENWERQQEEGG